LLVWLANQGAHWAGGLRAGQYVTTGSWTAKDVVPPGAEVRIVFDHAGEAAVEFSA
jgi:2-keto-4-pentenoate hydratase